MADPEGLGGGGEGWVLKSPYETKIFHFKEEFLEKSGKINEYSGKINKLNSFVNYAPYQEILDPPLICCVKDCDIKMILHDLLKFEELEKESCPLK